MSATFDIKGADKLKRELDRLPHRMMRGGESASLRAGAKVIVTAAKSRAPRRTGLLIKALGSNVKRIGRQVTARVGARKGWSREETLPNGRRRTIKPVNYTRLVEFGTSHSAAKPFIRPAVEETKGQVVVAMAKGLELYLERAAARARQ
jgi:HK97 gp10 family phage protein